MPMAVCNDQSFLVAVLTLGLEALAAVHGTIATGLEGHLGGAAAAVADHFVHLTGAIVVAAVLGTTGSAASGAAGGLILEALLGEESLLGSGEVELGAAVTAGQGLILVHGGIPPYILHPYLLPFSCFHGSRQLVCGATKGGMNLATWLGLLGYYITFQADCTVPDAKNISILKCYGMGKLSVCILTRNAIK